MAVMRTSLCLVVAVVATTVCLCASDTGVVSSTVGYVLVTVPGNGGGTLIGMNLKRTNASAPLLASEVFGTDQLEKGDTASSADVVYIWDAAKAGGGGWNAYFQRPDGSFRDAEILVASDPAVLTGAALFVRTKPGTGNRLIMLTGEVVGEAQQSLAIPAGLSPLANPYATALDLNHAAGDEWSGATAGILPTLADNIWVWNPDKQPGGGYDVYFLHSTTHKWHRIDAPAVAADAALLALGRGGFYSARQPFVNRLTRPYAR